MKLTKLQRAELVELLQQDVLLMKVKHRAQQMLKTTVLINVIGYNHITLYDANNNYKVIGRVNAKM